MMTTQSILVSSLFSLFLFLFSFLLFLFFLIGNRVEVDLLFLEQYEVTTSEETMSIVCHV